MRPKKPWRRVSPNPETTSEEILSGPPASQSETHLTGIQPITLPSSRVKKHTAVIGYGMFLDEGHISVQTLWSDTQSIGQLGQIWWMPSLAQF